MAQSEGLVPPPPALAARSWLLLDYQSGQVITARNADERAEPASLTKVMSSYIAFRALREKHLTATQVIPVSVKAWKTPGSRMFVEPNRPVTVDELLKGMVVQSGNDATVALAEALGGSEEGFATLMNREAARLGMKGTHFVTATGLPDPQHYTTAADLGRLSAAVIRDFPEYFPLYSMREYTYNRITQSNRNELLGRDPHVDGLKTGYTENAGYCLIATARREEWRLIAVVMGTASESARATEAQKLLNYGFQFYETVRVYARDATVAELPVWKGAASKVRAGLDQDLFVTVQKGQTGALKARLESMQPLVAPVAARQRVGTLRITMADKPYGEYPVLALEDVGVANFLGRTWDSLRLMVR